MKDGWLIKSRELLCSWTDLQHLEEDTANQYDAEIRYYGLNQLTHSLTAKKKNMSLKMTDSLWKSTVDGLA